MRPAPLAAGLNFCWPGNVSRRPNGTSSADARRETESAMPLDVRNLTKSRREVFTMPLCNKSVSFLLADASLRGLLAVCFGRKILQRLRPESSDVDHKRCDSEKKPLATAFIQ